MTTLDPNTTYNFTLTDGAAGPDRRAVHAVHQQLHHRRRRSAPAHRRGLRPGASDQPRPTKTWTSITIGPDNKVYAATITGEILRFTMNADGTLGSRPALINTITSNNGGDPGDHRPDLRSGGHLQQPDPVGHPRWRGAEGGPGLDGQAQPAVAAPNLATYQDYVTNFPRSYKDHMTNSIAFKTGEPGVIYITQGSMNAMGAPDNAWGQRAEHLMAAAILRGEHSTGSPARR